MRISFVRRKNSDLPLYNGRRSPSRPSSPHRKVITRKHILIGLFILLLIVLFRPTAGSQKKVASPLSELLSAQGLFHRERSPKTASTAISMLARTYSIPVSSSLSRWPAFVPVSIKTVPTCYNQEHDTQHWQWNRMTRRIIVIISPSC